MKPHELVEWARNALPGTMIPASEIAKLELDYTPPAETGGEEYLPTAEWARRKLGGARSAKTVARWCRTRKIEGARQLPNGQWLVPASAEPPGAEEQHLPPRPANRLRLVEAVRRASNDR